MRRFLVPTGLLLCLPLVLVACGGDDGGPDTRCFGVAQVEAWQIQITTNFSGRGVKDSFDVRLHHNFDATETTTAPAFDGDGVLWFSGVPTVGTIVVHDTIILTNSNDTVTATSTGFAPPGSDGGVGGLYVSANLATCTAAIGGLIYSGVDYTQNGAPGEGDTLFIGYPFASGFTITAAVVGGDALVLGPQKVRSVTANSAFSTAPEYRVGGLTGPWANTTTTAIFDSATSAWSAVPVSVAAPAGGAPPPFAGLMLQNGGIVARPPR